VDTYRTLPTPRPAPRPAKLDPHPRQEVADVNLSFSELKVGFECPYAFKLRFMYGFNPPIAEALGFGKSLHDALFELHDRALRGGDTSPACVDDLVDRHLFLPFAYRELRERLTATAQARLREYIMARGATFADIEHAERPVEIDLGDGIRVSGRVDLIRRRSTGEIVIIDFKSRERVQQEDVSSLQLRTYAIGYRQATGQDAAAVVVENLDDLDRPRVEHIVPAHLEAAQSAIRTFATQLRHNNLPRRPRGPDEQRRRKTCSRCDLTGICGTPFAS
jgi:DNA helicase-2/ATP-dependent DNA helicase PcrA